MTFTQSISSGFRRYFDVRTRSSRSEYWWWTLFALLLSVVMTIMDKALFGGTEILDTASSLFLFIPGITVAVRRLHDVGRSGWWLLIAFTIVGIIYPLLYWHINPGMKGPNKYGPEPVQTSSDPSFAGETLFAGTSDGTGDGTGDVTSEGRSSHSGSRTCAVCSSALEPGANFCLACGSKTYDFEEAAKFCSNCGLKMELDAKFCFSCGTG
ncbi:MAG: DUF805 domain-containing protein, partial [Dehalococcoidia bacterium]|nr:DUF805 domain-containing protein [Dehalococcoidia bacterium]